MSLQVGVFSASDPRNLRELQVSGTADHLVQFPAARSGCGSRWFALVHGAASEQAGTALSADWTVQGISSEDSGIGTAWVGGGEYGFTAVAYLRFSQPLECADG